MLLPQWRRVVVKLGTQVVVEDSVRFATERVSHLLNDFLDGVEERILVTSGAVGLGRAALNARSKSSLSVSEKQACAAVGQSRLINEYDRLLQKRNIRAAQILVTSDDLTHAQKFHNFSETLKELLRSGAFPIINENDSVSIAELQPTAEVKAENSFGDNDRLSALVATKVEADLLVILSDIDGFYKTNPKVDPKAEKLTWIEDEKILSGIESAETSAGGRGGVRTKIEAVQMAARNGIYTVVASGFQPGILKQILSMREWSDHVPCTWVAPKGKRL